MRITQGLVMGKSLSTQLWSAHFPGRFGNRGVSKACLSLWSRKPFAGGLRRTQGKLSSPSLHRTQLSTGKGMAALRLDAVLDVLSDSTSQVLNWQRPKL